jgi:hypothetical protein
MKRAAASEIPRRRGSYNSYQLSVPVQRVRRHQRYTARLVHMFRSAKSRDCAAAVALEQVHARTAPRRTTGRPVEFLYGRWQSGSAPVQGCTTRAEAYACTLQIVVPLADRSPFANGLWQNTNHERKGWKRGLAAFFHTLKSQFVLVHGALHTSACRWPGDTILIIKRLVSG